MLLVVDGTLAAWSEFDVVGVVSWWCVVAVATVVSLSYRELR